jgi:hypothetical protein
MSLFPAESKQTVTLDSVPSSRGLGFYDVRLGKDNTFYCTCAGWIHSKKPVKMCRHLSAWVVKNLDRVYDLMLSRHGDVKGNRLCNKLIQSANEYDGKRK